MDLVGQQNKSIHAIRFRYTEQISVVCALKVYKRKCR